MEYRMPDYTALMGVIRRNDEQKVQAELEKFWEKLQPALESSRELVTQHLLAFATEITARQDADGETIDALSAHYTDFVRGISSAGSEAELKELLFGFCQQVFISYSKFASDTGYQRISAIQQYVKAHIGEELSLAEIGERFYLNSAYLSRLFKEKTGMTFSDYVGDCRVDAAKELLIGTGLSVFEISRRVGYEDANSFSRLFKKYTGLPPQKYRAQNRAGSQDGIPIPAASAVGDFDMGPCIFASDDMNFADFFLNRD